MNKDKIKIIYEDENILAINKPSGLVVHPDGKTVEPTLVDWILKNYPEIEDVGEPLVLGTGEIIKRPGIVDPLDRETSGILLIAKNQKTFLFLKEQFKERDIKKSYRAFVYGEMKMEEGIIDRPIGRSNKDFRMWSAQRGARGQMRTAITEYHVLEKGNGFSFVEANPKTGRTHQIRVHFKAINHPIVSDSLYAPKKEKGLGFERLALHSYSIEFSLPEGKKIKLEAELPKDFERALKQILDK